MKRTIHVTLLMLLAAAPVSAQESFSDVQHTFRPGDTVFLTDDTRIETKGEVAGVGPSALRLEIDGMVEELVR